MAPKSWLLNPDSAESAFDSDEFDLEDEGRVRTDGTTRALFAIGEVGGNERVAISRRSSSSGGLQTKL